METVCLERHRVMAIADRRQIGPTTHSVDAANPDVVPRSTPRKFLIGSLMGIAVALTGVWLVYLAFLIFRAVWWALV